jgi:hypothetical protein
MNIAERSLFILTARLLWGTNMGHKKDAQGREIPIPEYNYTAGFNTQPEHFEFELKPRNEKRLGIIKEAYAASRKGDPLVN